MYSTTEDFTNYEVKKFLITPPFKPHHKIIRDNFRYKTWDGTNWTCQIVNNKFYVRQMGSNKIYPTRVLNILRFRSQQWQVAYIKDSNKFLVYRFGGIRGMLFDEMDLVDWNDRSYTVKILT